jgi:glycosyltransferase involved in cell wall biosynthesis
MRIGNFISVVAGERGFEHNVSGHIQIPLEGMRRLREAGHEVHLITNEYGPDRSMPACLDPEIPVHLVTDSRNRGGILTRAADQGRGFKLLALKRQANQIKRLCREHEFDLLHLHGYNRTAHLGGGLRLAGLDCPVVCTVFAALFPERFSLLTRRFWKRVDAMVTSTEFVRRGYAAQRLNVDIVRHGLIRDLRQEHDGSPLGPRKRVLFWRDPSTANGADLAVESYQALAPKYPDVDFDFAIRPYWDPVDGIDELAQLHDNVHVFRFPYEDGVTLPKLLLESLCVLQPMRRLTINPQLVIAESLAAGIPTIASDLDSTSEVVQDGVTGRLVPVGDAGALTEALDDMLSDRAALADMGEAAAADIKNRWSWNYFLGDITSVYERVTKGRAS